MVSLYYAKISTINYKAGTAGVTLEDREKQVIQDVPFLAAFYEMPSPGDTVAVLFEEIAGQIGKGVILGKIFLSGKPPGKSGPDIFYKQFKDGASVMYSTSSQELEITARKLVVDELLYNTLTQR
ncbi:MAG: hypothetical protein NC417_09045 [Candidatus Gastranaerophilales bacterium]|nr:hypothetical protein [Candidatus Gastranaerophilales bacterium]